jgi:hypothetical protein
MSVMIRGLSKVLFQILLTIFFILMMTSCSSLGSGSTNDISSLLASTADQSNTTSDDNTGISTPADANSVNNAIDQGSGDQDLASSRRLANGDAANGKTSQSSKDGAVGAPKDSSSTDQTTNPPTQAAIDSTGKPAEVPQNIWDYAIKAASELGKDKNFALLLCAMIKDETSFGADLSGNSPSVGDGLMQVEPSSRDQLASEFQSTFGHTYDNNSPQDQVRIGALAINNCLKNDDGNIEQALLHYNGGDNWTPDTKDAYGRTVDAQGYSNYIYRIYKSYGGT